MLPIRCCQLRGHMRDPALSNSDNMVRIAMRIVEGQKGSNGGNMQLDEADRRVRVESVVEGSVDCADISDQ